jgi:hypothetical protein
VPFHEQVGGCVSGEITLDYSLQSQLLHDSMLGGYPNHSAVIVISQPKAYGSSISLGKGKMGQKDQNEDLNNKRIISFHVFQMVGLPFQ